MKIEGAVALVTGANRGIGKATVTALLQRGASKVYAGARNPETVQLDDPRVVPVRLDVTDDDQVTAAATLATDVGLVVNNAGIAEPGTALQTDLPGARRQFEVNVLGVVRITQAFAPVLAANGGGGFVNVLSVGSWVASPMLAMYSATKSAAWAYSNAARIELRRQGTHVVGVHVGYVDTDLTAGLDAQKTAPAVVADAALDALEAGHAEAVVDEISRQVKAGLSDDHGLIYPIVEQDFLAAIGQER